MTTIESGPDATTVDTEATFHWVANELNVNFECRIDSGSFAPCAWTGNPAVVGGSAGSITYNGLSVGTHTFQVRATDVDGNVGAPAGGLELGASPPPPVLTNVGCSEVVTHSIALNNDLIDCLGVGLIVGANDVTIDLNGHVIDGTGIDAGVLNNGHDSVTVKGGHIHEFDYGVQLNPGSSENVVTGVRLENNQEAGIGLSDADQNGQGNTIRGNTITGNGWGVGLFAGSRHTVIRDNRFEGNQDDRRPHGGREPRSSSRQRHAPLRRRRRVHAGRRQQPRGRQRHAHEPRRRRARRRGADPVQQQRDRGQHDRGQRRARHRGRRLHAARRSSTTTCRGPTAPASSSSSRATRSCAATTSPPAAPASRSASRTAT